MNLGQESYITIYLGMITSESPWNPLVLIHRVIMHKIRLRDSWTLLPKCPGKNSVKYKRILIQSGLFDFLEMSRVMVRESCLWTPLEQVWAAVWGLVSMPGCLWQQLVLQLLCKVKRRQVVPAICHLDRDLLEFPVPGFGAWTKPLIVMNRVITRASTHVQLV